MSENYILTKRGQCRSCKKEATFTLWRQMFSNGSENFLWQCQCGTKNPERSPQLYIPKETILKTIPEELVDKLPTSMPAFAERCARCGNRGTERQHWAPVAIFGREEADKWPQDYLCKACHDHWHRLVTPQLTTDNGRIHPGQDN